MRRRLRCFACGITESIAPVRHFNLVVSIQNPPTSRGAGSIDLCERCWRGARKASKIHNRPRRKVA
jgi:hypothetical protein